MKDERNNMTEEGKEIKKTTKRKESETKDGKQKRKLKLYKK